ncbi:MAG: hypothetical protein KY461_12795 [Actinobacteria bacterium]|nr:hypothetical protein [Actinomycetota bacterium]
MSAQSQRHPGNGTRGANGSDGPAAVTTAAAHTRDGILRRMVRDDRSADMRPDETHTHPAGSTASADAVEQLRRGLTDIKHDVRMLKVVLDKQSLAIDRLAAKIDELGSNEEE